MLVGVWQLASLYLAVTGVADLVEKESRLGASSSRWAMFWRC